MNELCHIIRESVKPNFENLRIAIRKYDRDTLCLGSPCWRWVYHTLHSADKWFINPYAYEEPAFQEPGMDNPLNPCTAALSDAQLMEYLERIEQKTIAYLDSITDEMLYEKPEGCPYTRMELVLRQFRHISFHTGMLDGQTTELTGEFPGWVSNPGQ